jgi:hypothetical protein
MWAAETHLNQSETAGLDQTIGQSKILGQLNQWFWVNMDFLGPFF